MNKLILTAALAAVLAGPALAQKEPRVGGAAMYPTKNIIENAVNSKDHTTLVAAVKAADLAETLSSPGPFTVFAPTNAAFDALPKGTVDDLLKPESKEALQGVLTYHVLAGKFDSKAVAAAIKKGGGKVVMKTVAGGELTFSMKGDKLMVTDQSGGSAMVTIADVYQSNGVIHVIDKVLLPKM
ncbi:MAG: fasciclin domain-containing protein [Flavobacteriales bacterium]|nr:fasciclin domain-containing protein [Flavobacteriales bacterium]